MFRSQFVEKFNLKEGQMYISCTCNKMQIRVLCKLLKKLNIEYNVGPDKVTRTFCGYINNNNEIKFFFSEQHLTSVDRIITIPEMVIFLHEVANKKQKDRKDEQEFKI